MAKSVLKGLVTPATYSENYLFLLTNAYLSFDTAAWDAALPGGNSGKSVNLEFSMTTADGTFTYGLKLKGDFTKTEGMWGGEVTYAILQIDGEKVGAIEVNSGADLGQLIYVQNSTLIWNELTSTGVRGGLTGGTDAMNGSVSDDNLNGRGGADFLNGGLGNDRILGGAGNDELDGHRGDDILLGGGGNDLLKGRDGSDVAKGGGGKDTFFADSNGQNEWTGGKGADLFQPGAWFGTENVSTEVTDFKKSQGDQIDLSNDSYLLFNFADVDEIHYIGKKAFTATEGRFEIRMQDGYVEIDQNGDGIADRGIKLDGHDTFSIRDTSWILLADGFDFA